ncbi:hypothetical protein POM88_029110 [Heracleum sosnowskyi]|uniref:Uncharacterized protein n=1 Tax=Heracleum sosnowskyi TaxID=360622 RepID=A0AAD8MHG1_9APIA|nr:hypothetical protein POM88_029110 [Heracleum sosnowskyi]
MGKGKDKLPEYILSRNIWSEGTEFSQEEANALMVDYRESTLYNHDDEFSRIVENAMLEPSRRLSNCSTLLKQQIIRVCVKINEEKRWAIDVYLNNGISMFITMQLLQNLPAKEGNREEAHVQEKKDVGATEEEESEILEALEANILRCVVDSINAEKDTVTKEAVMEDTVLKEVVKENTVVEDTVMKDIVKENAVKDEIKPTVKPKRKKSLARAWFSRQEPEPEETIKAKKGKTKYSGKEKATGLGRNLRKLIQIKHQNSLELLHAKFKEIRNVEVELDANKEASMYTLWWDSSR